MFLKVTVFSTCLLVHSAPILGHQKSESLESICCCCWSLFEVDLCRLVVFSFALLCLLCSRTVFLTSAAEDYVEMLYWVVSSIKRWSWSYGLVQIYKYVWTDFDDVYCWRMCWLLFEKCCCFCWSNSCWSVCCSEISADVFRRCCL